MTPGQHVIGRDNSLPWKLSTDMKRFKELTTGKPIIMGRKTYESIGGPLPNRTNIVLTFQRDYEAPGCEVYHNIEDAINFCSSIKSPEVMIIGGSNVYRQAMSFADELLISFVMGCYDGDTYFPKINESWSMDSIEHLPAGEKDDCPHSFAIFKRKLDIVG